MADLDREDGELEDGELDDDEEIISPPNNKEMPPKETVISGEVELRAKNQDYRREISGDSGSHHSFPDPSGSYGNYGSHAQDGSESSGDEYGRKGDRKRRKKRRKEKEKYDNNKGGQKKKRRRGHYVDYDKVDDMGNATMDNYEGEGWPGYGNKSHHSRGGRGYESHGSNDSREGSPARGKSDRGSYYDYKEVDYRGRSSRSPPGPYDNPYQSPTGQYESPEDEERRSKYMKLDSRDGRSSEQSSSMLDMLGKEGYVDPNVALAEKEEIYDKNVKNKRKQEKRQNWKDNHKKRDKDQDDKHRKRRDESTRDGICKYFLDGKCHRGDMCQYSHGQTKEKERPRRERKELCRHYQRGGCDREHCIFMHGDYPCRYFHEGTCTMGLDCRYSHEEMTDEIRAILDHNEGDGKDKTKKPSLLGSPPRHIKEQLEKVKKIPSLFDIKVEPPKKPTNIMPGVRPGGLPGPRGPMPPNTMSPNGPRPGAFYNDMMNSPGRMPMMGPHNGPPPPIGPMGMRPPMGIMGPGPNGPPPPRGPNMPPPPGFMGNFFAPPGMPNINLQVPEGMMMPENKENQSDSTSFPGDDLDLNDGETADFVSQLTPSQRELFLKLRHKQSSKKAVEGFKAADDNWYSSDEDATKTNTDGAPKLDISAMLTMIRNSVTSSAGQGSTGAQTTPAVRDPRMGGGGATNTTTRSDPRARNPPPDPRQPPAAPTTSTIATNVGLPLGVSPLNTQSQRGFDPDKVINASMHHTGGIPYFLYKFSVETMRPMLPKNIDPDDPKFVDDPRVRRYIRIGGEKSNTIDPRRRMSASDGNSPDTLQRLDSKPGVLLTSAPPPIPKALIEPLSVPKQDVDAVKLANLPEGLNKPLIPLPKLLDPRMARQFSLDKDEKDRKSKEQTSPGSASKTPFSHRNDPRFRKKSKDGPNTYNSALNSSTDSDSNSNPVSHSEAEGKLSSKSASKLSDDEEQTVQSEHKSQCEEGDQQDFDIYSDIAKSDETLITSHRHSPSNQQFTGDRLKEDEEEENEDSENTDRNFNDFPTSKSERIPRKDPMEFASPLGYYSEAPTDSYNNYSTNKFLANNKMDTDSSSINDNDKSDPRNNRMKNQPKTDPENVENIYMSSDMTEDDIPEKSLKDMFNIDPTASPFGSIG